MKEDTPELTAASARRLALTKQHLAGALPARPGRDDIISTVRDIAFVQWDPVAVVAPSHLIALWARLGRYNTADVEKMLWEDRSIFLHWTPTAWLVLTEDYPLYLTLMKGYPDSLTSSWGSQRERAGKFLASHRALRERVLKELGSGPLRLTGFGSYASTRRKGDEWSPGSDLSTMLSHLHMAGEVMVAGREAGQNIWGLTGDFLPAWAERKVLPQAAMEKMAAERAIKALGTATRREIHHYFIRGRYNDIGGALASLLKDGTIRKVKVEGWKGRDDIYIHCDDLPLHAIIESGAWKPRMSLLAPFDNMICSREWTKRLFQFEYVHEQFLPREKRRFGAFVLPVVNGDRVIGRIDPKLDIEGGILHVNSVHAEPGMADEHAAPLLRETIQRFSEFLGAEEVAYTRVVPREWRRELR